MFNELLSRMGMSVAAANADANAADAAALMNNMTTATPDAKSILIVLLLGVLVGFLISLLYIITHRKSGYSQSYVMTLLILPPIVAIVLSMINSMASALRRLPPVMSGFRLNSRVSCVALCGTWDAIRPGFTSASAPIPRRSAPVGSPPARASICRI